MTRRVLAVLSFLAVILALPLSAYAQGGTTGAIAGVVVDDKGAPISNVQIEVTVAGSSNALRTVYSDGAGNFTVASLPVGSYDVAVKATGFSTSKYNNVGVRLTETTRLNPSLRAAQS